MTRRLRVLTQSELRTHRRCAREHYYAYELGFRPALDVARPLGFGRLVHVALEAWWKAPAGERLAHAYDALAAHAATTDEHDLGKAVAMLTGYDARWHDEQEQWDVLGVEVEFRAPLINPLTGAPSRTFVLGGKLDAVVRGASDGALRLVEHKTSSENVTPGSEYWRVLMLDAQVSTYYVGLRVLFPDEPIAGVVYDVLGKPAIKPLKATPETERKYRKVDGELYHGQREVDETAEAYRDRCAYTIACAPDRYLQRGSVVRLEQEETEAAWDAWVQAALIREGNAAERWPRNPDSCKRYGRLCSYFGVCTGTERLDDPIKFRLVENRHEELTPEPVDLTTH